MIAIPIVFELVELQLRGMLFLAIHSYEVAFGANLGSKHRLIAIDVWLLCLLNEQLFELNARCQDWLPSLQTLKRKTSLQRLQRKKL